MDDLELIERFRQICGDKVEGEGYFLNISSVSRPVPNFVDYDQDASFPEIIIRPFITKTPLVETIVYCGENEAQTRKDIQYNHARFQIDVFGNSLIDVMKIKTALERRIYDFSNVEIVAFKEPVGWSSYSANTYVNHDYTTPRIIARITDPLAKLTKADSIEEVENTNGSWFMDDTGLYVNPLIDMASIEIFEVLNGKVFKDGKTLHDVGIHTISVLNSRNGNYSDKDMPIKYWSYDYMITYREVIPRNIGESFEEIDLDVSKN